MTAGRGGRARTLHGDYRGVLWSHKGRSERFCEASLTDGVANTMRGTYSGGILMNAPCPACGAQLHYLHDDIGRTISCRQCGARLEVDSGGLHATCGGGHPGQATAGAGAAEVLPAVAANPGAHFTPRAAEARPAWMDIASWVFLLGLLIVLPAVFVPMIMRSGLQRLEGRMIEGQIPVNQKRHEIDALRRKKEDDPKLKERSDKVAERRKDLDKRRNDAQAEMNKAASDEAFRAAQAKMEKVMQDDEPLRKDEEDLRIDKDKARTAAEKELSKENDDLAKKERDWLTERDKLDDERQKSQASALWWSPIFMSILAFGSIVLAVGALGLLGPRQTVARRVVGAVTLGLLVLLLFNKLAGGRGLLALASGGDYDYSTPSSA